MICIAGLGMTHTNMAVTKSEGWAKHLGICFLLAIAPAACTTSPGKPVNRIALDATHRPHLSKADFADPAELRPATGVDLDRLLAKPSDTAHPERPDDREAPAEIEPGLTRGEKTLFLNAGAATALTIWGIYQWDYGQVAPNAASEHWFGQETKEGGSDKLGHFWSAYALSHLFASIYDSWDYTEDEATIYGSLSSAGFQTLMELGDLFSSFGFSYEDMIMNTAGAGAGYLLRTYPRLGEKIDFRLEYAPSLDGGNDTDIFTDYEHHKYLVALKGSGFESMKGSVLEYLELQSGYFSRGYDDFVSGEADNRRRTFYFGLGLNVGRVISHVWKTSLFDYFQVPGIYIPIERDLDQ